jgi:molybdopterin-guanine dinucleotide biosynthesis protein A
MQTNHENITGILLAGGMSRRMGTEKGSLKIGRKLLYEYPLALLEEVCDEVLISSCKDSAIRTQHRIICDEVKGIGPLGGIYSCLKQSSNELNVVLSYDMPMVNKSLFRLLIGESDAYDIVMPAMQEKRPEPLCALYRKNVAGVIQEMISHNDFAVNHLLKRCRGRIVPVLEEMECWHPDLFLNINSREDLDRIPPGFGS